ncbi:MAG TPA: hypothetical protein DCW58_04005 [Candidatus Pacebacteria bacterium]|nr:hypothetical protein [Candidatus Paceibacterota bacterium]
MGVLVGTEAFGVDVADNVAVGVVVPVDTAADKLFDTMKSTTTMITKQTIIPAISQNFSPLFLNPEAGLLGLILILLLPRAGLKNEFSPSLGHNLA